ncbi:hypothetical protein [Fibrella forsythiae]|uniref:Uncharacterized protein n=1 Tax=Fibrella forsythiae TaxID=2817061 RepID=A0ABS3JBV4_9BACT|nr:hypothetical protein [Fibrella forsythiae]MBO0947479.1 hypothetical protein [Fibrella forsythiae]
MKINFQSIILLTLLAVSLVFGIKQCRRADSEQTDKEKANAAVATLKTREAAAYAYADSITKKSHEKTKQFAAAVAAMPPAMRTALNRQLLAEFDSADSLRR